jgi:hypothetical protein
MTENSRHLIAKGVRWAARVIGLFATLLGLFIWIGEGIYTIQTEGFGAIQIEGVLVGLLVMALAGCIVSWWRDWLAGILLILTFLGLVILVGVTAGSNQVGAGLMFGSPFLVAGLLFFTSSWLSKGEGSTAS